MLDRLELKKGNCLMTACLHYHSLLSEEEDIQIGNDTDNPERMDAPVNLDYNLDHLDSGRYYDFDGDRYNLMDSGAPCKLIFSVEHKDRNEEPTTRCSACRGSGRCLCSNCKGSGREQYEDGYFASGEARIKTTACHECDGQGKIPCLKCEGSGQMRVYAPRYSVMRYVTETRSVSVSSYYCLPWCLCRFISSPEELDSLYNLVQDKREQLSALFEAVYSQGTMSFILKNRKEFHSDNRKDILAEMEKEGVSDLYKEIQDSLEKQMASTEKVRGRVIARKEISYLFPIMLLQVTCANGNDIKFFLYEEDGNARAAMSGIFPTTSKEALKIKIHSLFKSKP
ncbi:MAG: hypothetical protein ACOX5T_02405 [Candidatus Cryptobacteroides sp.]